MKNDHLVICRCEEVTQADIKVDISLGDLVTGILARETNQTLQELKPSTSRPPTRVLPLGTLSRTTQDDD